MDTSRKYKAAELEDRLEKWRGWGRNFRSKTS